MKSTANGQEGFGVEGYLAQVASLVEKARSEPGQKDGAEHHCKRIM
jgi:hypothetical protein